MQPTRVDVIFNLFRDEGSNPSASNLLAVPDVANPFGQAACVKCADCGDDCHHLPISNEESAQVIEVLR